MDFSAQNPNGKMGGNECFERYPASHVATSTVRRSHDKARSKRANATKATPTWIRVTFSTARTRAAPKGRQGIWDRPGVAG